MDNIDSGIRILELKVKKDKIYWYLWKTGAQEGYNRKLANDEENLEMTPLSRSTIKLLVEQLQLLAEMISAYQAKAKRQDRAIAILNKLVTLLGEHLYKALFKGKIHIHLSDALKDDDVTLLRVELEFEDEELASWPWEYLYRPRDNTPESGEFLARATQLVLNRRLSIEPSSLPLNTPKPVKLLLVVSQPKDEELDKVEYQDVLQALQALSDKQVVGLETLIEKVDSSPNCRPTVTRKNFRDSVEKFQPNIIHFIGHGQCRDGQGQVAFVKPDNCTPSWVKDEEFALLASRSKELKLVFLQACESMLPNDLPDSYNSISGIALQLAQRNIPAVVAIQYKGKSNIANAFAYNFYQQALANEEPVAIDLAVKAAREVINDEFSEDPQYHAFGLPVLYLQSYGSIIEKVSAKVSIVAPIVECPNCHTSISSDKYCPGCGLRFICLFCGLILKGATAKFCNECGKPSMCQACGKKQLDKKDSLQCSTCRNLNSPLGLQDSDFEDSDRKPRETTIGDGTDLHGIIQET